MEYPRKPITIKEVAERAGVAISTVSRVLNDLDRVSDETRQKVQQAAQDLGYVKNNLAASMKTGSTKLIVVIVPDIINEYYTAVIQGAEEVAVSRGYYTLVFSTNDSKQKEEQLFRGQFDRIIDGVIIIPAHDNMEFLKQLKKPVVIVDRYVPGSHMEAVVIDNFKGSYLLTKELVDAGHRDIGLLMGPLTFNIGQERLGGFYRAMEEGGVPVQQQYIKECTWYMESGYEKAMELLSMEHPPTAIYATNNLLCIGCVEAIANKGLRLGKDISLVGFDDTLLAKYMDPGITVVRRATIQMGRLGAEKLLNKLQGVPNENAPRKIVMDVELIRRGSVVRLNQ